MWIDWFCGLYEHFHLSFTGGGGDLRPWQKLSVTINEKINFSIGKSYSWLLVTVMVQDTMSNVTDR